MPERLIGAVLKTVVRASVPWVRIPPPPPFKRVRKGSFFNAFVRGVSDPRLLPLVVVNKRVSLRHTSCNRSHFLCSQTTLVESHLLLHLKESERALFKWRRRGFEGVNLKYRHCERIAKQSSCDVVFHPTYTVLKMIEMLFCFTQSTRL